MRIRLTATFYLNQENISARFSQSQGHGFSDPSGAPSNHGSLSLE